MLYSSTVDKFKTQTAASVLRCTHKSKQNSTNIEHAYHFKNHLDVLPSISDQPILTGLMKSAESNCCLHQKHLWLNIEKNE